MWQFFGDVLRFGTYKTFVFLLFLFIFILELLEIPEVVSPTVPCARFTHFAGLFMY